MAIAFRSVGTAVANGLRTNTTVSAPAGAVNGSDVIVVAIDVGNSSSVTISTPSGWTAAGSQSYGNTDPWTVNLYLFVRVHDGASSWTFNHASGYSDAVAVAWQGVDNTTPLDTTPAGNTGAQSTTAVLASINITTAGAMEIAARGSWDGNAITPPGSWTERRDQPVLWLGDLPAVGTGATGTTNIPAGNTSNGPWGTVHAALRPDTGAGAPALPPPLIMQTRRAF